MVQIVKNIHLNSIGKNKKKRQIILANTKRNLKDYILSLKYRLNGEYNKAPHYVISREGEIYQFLSVNSYSNYFSKYSNNKEVIIILLENLGWLEKIPLSDEYINWINDIYRGEIFERKWRDYFFWQPYPDKQIEVCAELCKSIMNKHSINKKCVGHNTKVNGIEKFEGISSKSNYDSKFTELSPAFDFEKFIKYIENEQFV